SLIICRGSAMAHLLCARDPTIIFETPQNLSEPGVTGDRDGSMQTLCGVRGRNPLITGRSIVLSEFSYCLHHVSFLVIERSVQKSRLARTDDSWRLTPLNTGYCLHTRQDHFRIPAAAHLEVCHERTHT